MMKIKVFGLVVVSQCVSKHSIFLPEDREQIWREINRPLTSKPAAVLEGRCTSISNRYCCCCREKFFVRFVAWDLRSNPWLVMFFPFLPQPPQPEASSKALDIEDTQAT
jgi:hypothetical protein